MAAQTLGFRTAEFLVSEANGYRSRDEVSVTAVSALPAGQLLGKVTVGASSGAYVAYSASATNGAETVAGILFEGVPASTTADRTIINSDAEVNLAHVTYTGTKAVVVAGLAALGIKVREE